MQEKKDISLAPVRYVKGVGPKRGELLESLGIRTVADLLYYLPRRYEDRSKLLSIGDIKIGDYGTIQGSIGSVSSRKTKRGISLFQISVADKSGSIQAVWFNQPFLNRVFKVGQKVVLYGKIELYERLQMNHPEYEIVEEDENDSLHIGRIVPIYALTSQVTQRYLRTLIKKTVSLYAQHLTDTLPTNIRARQKLVDIRFAIHHIHFPASFESLKMAYQRLVFEEFFYLQLALAKRRRDLKVDEAGLAHAAPGTRAETFLRSLPFELTEGQKKAILDIEKDMSSKKPMNRLLEGDVGSGKTIVAAHALLNTVNNGFQGILMAPTEVLARQHYLVLSELLMPMGVSVALLVRGIDPEKKERLLGEIRKGTINIIVGTHAIIQEKVICKSVGLVIIDEQHKFGVTQRALLRQKGYNPHVLVMTATPIPRTLALTVYGDLDVSVIRELPAGRKPISTYWIEEERRGEVYAFVREEIKKGRQAYIVYPLIERSRRASTRSATEMYEKLKHEVFSDCSVGLIHGRMEPGRKDAAMKDFKDGKTEILVSTVIIEVGIDVPNATCMVIENAERFGLSQLHQLRGRIGRGGFESYCILLSNPTTEMAARRLSTIEETIDGFQIAEEDLEMRGPGEFLGTRQHGLPEIRFGDISRDFQIMERARKEAFSVIHDDPDLAEERHRLMRADFFRRYRGSLDLIKVG